MPEFRHPVRCPPILAYPLFASLKPFETKQRAKTSEMTDQENVQRQSQNPVGFGAYKSPIQISYIGAIRGHATPSLAEPFSYLEIGCDRGVGLAMLADCYPNGKFVAFEEDASNVAAARELAEKGALSNMEVIEGSLEGDDFQSLPDFNFIGIGGAYSWLSPKAREGFARLVRKKLLPGGMVYLAYTAMPGAVQTDTFYKFIPITDERRRACAGCSSPECHWKIQSASNGRRCLFSSASDDRWIGAKFKPCRSKSTSVGRLKKRSGAAPILAMSTHACLRSD